MAWKIYRQEWLNRNYEFSSKKCVCLRQARPTIRTQMQWNTPLPNVASTYCGCYGFLRGFFFSTLQRGKGVVTVASFTKCFNRFGTDWGTDQPNWSIWKEICAYCLATWEYFATLLIFLLTVFNLYIQAGEKFCKETGLHSISGFSRGNRNIEVASLLHISQIPVRSCLKYVYMHMQLALTFFKRNSFQM